jgi:uncharacterized membrane protein
MTIRNPVEWSAGALGDTVTSLRGVSHSMRRPAEEFDVRPITVRRVSFADLGDALREGLDDFAALRTDVLAIGLIYPLAGLVLGHLAMNVQLLPLLFPLIAGFALLGPFAALGLYEASRRRERGEPTSWTNVVDAFDSPSAGAIWTLGLIMTGLFLVWLAAATLIFLATMGPAWPSSIGQFAHDVFATPGGWAMIVLGCGVGALFALIALSISVVSFPLLLDRKVRIGTAIETSARVVRMNPETMLAWGAIVAGALALGALPLLLGLIVVMPVLGHATWRLYRKAVA